MSSYVFRSVTHVFVGIVSGQASDCDPVARLNNLVFEMIFILAFVSSQTTNTKHTTLTSVA